MKLPALLSSKRNRVIAILSVGAIWFVAWGAARLLIVTAPLEHADAIVVLSGSAAFVERTQLAAQLYAAGRAEKIILTNDNRRGGWLSSEQRNPYFYERARWELQRQGVPATSIEVIGPPVNGTRDEAAALRTYAEANGLKSLLLVTSAYHSRRALWTFRRMLAGLQVTVGMMATTPGKQTPRPLLWWLHLRGWQMVPGEYLKLAYYWFRL